MFQSSDVSDTQNQGVYVVYGTLFYALRGLFSRLKENPSYRCTQNKIPFVFNILYLMSAKDADCAKSSVSLRRYSSFATHLEDNLPSRYCRIEEPSGLQLYLRGNYGIYIYTSAFSCTTYSSRYTPLDIEGCVS